MTSTEHIGVAALQYNPPGINMELMRGPPPPPTTPLVSASLKSTALVPVKPGFIKWPAVEGQGGMPIDRSLMNIEEFFRAANIELKLNAFTHRTTVHQGSKTIPLDDYVFGSITMRMHESAFHPPEKFLFQAINDIAHRNRYHPVVEYLDGLKWDGTARLDKWLTTYGGAEDTELHNAYGRCQLMAAVARVYDPGCPKDEMLVFQGPGGMGKTTAIRTLAVNDDWFDDTLSAGMKPKEVIEQTAGKWLCEFAELDGLKKKETSAVKASLSRREDGSRLSYGKLREDRQRQFVTFGTTNHNSYLIDETGNRRFWCVPTPEFNITALKRDRDQLWAEAVQRYRAGGAKSYLLPESLWKASLEASREKTMVSPWFEMLQTELEGRTGYVSLEEVFEFLRIDRDKQQRYVSNDIRGHMERLGWQKAQRKFNGKNKWCFTNVAAGEQGKWLKLDEPEKWKPKDPAPAHGTAP